MKHTRKFQHQHLSARMTQARSTGLQEPYGSLDLLTPMTPDAFLRLEAGRAKRKPRITLAKVWEPRS